jgi:hypothetical protein
VAGRLVVDIMTSPLPSCRHWQHESMAQFHLTDKPSSLQKADEAKAIGHDDEAIIAYLLGGDQSSVSDRIVSWSISSMAVVIPMVGCEVRNQEIVQTGFRTIPTLSLREEDPPTPEEYLVRLPPPLTLFTHFFRSLPSVDRLEESSRKIFLSYVLWFGAHNAIQHGFWDVSCGMLGFVCPSP